MHSGGIPERKRYSIAWRRRRQRSHGWRNNCHFLVKKNIHLSNEPSDCAFAKLFASFIHVTFALPWGIRAQPPPQQTILVVILPAKKAVTPTERTISCMSAPFTPIPTCAWYNSSHPKETACCRPQGLWAAMNEHFRTVFCPMEVS